MQCANRGLALPSVGLRVQLVARGVPGQPLLAPHLRHGLCPGGGSPRAAARRPPRGGRGGHRGAGAALRHDGASEDPGPAAPFSF